MQEPDENIFLGNEDDLKDFKEHFGVHDKSTLDGYYRIAKKKKSFMVVRRLSSNAVQLQILIVPYALANSKGGMREAIKSRFFPQIGWIRALGVDPRMLCVFGEIIPKSEEQFKTIIKPRVKRRPFQSFIEKSQSEVGNE